MNALYLVDEIRALERAAAAQLAPGALMRRAGAAAATAALALLPPAGTQVERELLQAAGVADTQGLARAPGTADVLVLAGPGNNGGDALEMAAKLAQAGVPVHIVHLAGTGALAPETGHALASARASSAVFAEAIPAGVRWALVVDGLFGIGLARALDGAARALVEAINGLACPVLALDVPSGLDADTGSVVGMAAAGGDNASGAHAIAVRATQTITFIGDKPGLHTGQGCDHAGLVTVATLGVEAALETPNMKAAIATPSAAPADMKAAMPTLDAEAPKATSGAESASARAQLGGVPLFAAQLRARANNSHKGSYGDVAIVGGAHGMAGAPVLAGRAALYGGAGRVFVALLDEGPAYDSAHPELMLRQAAQLEFDGICAVLGPGMGVTAPAPAIVQRALASAAPLVLDADALNLIAATPALHAMLPRAAPTIMTPHPLEAARLLGVDSATVQADRLGAARTLAKRFGACVVVKGAGSVMARPDGQLVINTTGNPGLATAGTGDVLAGLCGSLLAQGWPAWEALLGAVWIHGTAGDLLVEQGAGPIGLTAGELPAALRTIRNRLVAGRRAP